MTVGPIIVSAEECSGDSSVVSKTHYHQQHLLQGGSLTFFFIATIIRKREANTMLDVKRANCFVLVVFFLLFFIPAFSEEWNSVSH